MFAKLERTLQNKARVKHKTPSHNKSNNNQWINNNRTTILEQKAAEATGGSVAEATRGLKCILLALNRRSKTYFKNID